jgi:hypothetical protein
VSAFRDLLAEAHAKGVRYMRFEVDLAQFFSDDQAESWTAAQITHYDTDDVYPDARGRTGEEALCRYVEARR